MKFEVPNWNLKIKVDENNKMRYIGKVKSGLGEAAMWMGMVKDIFEKRYGIDVFLGTLNIELEDEIVLDEKNIIEPEEYGGNFKLFVCKCIVCDEESYIIRTEKNNKVDGDHPLNIVEVVAGVNFREKYGLKDEDKVFVDF